MEGLVNDRRVGAAHISVYVALLQCREAQGGGRTIVVKKWEMMRLSKIQGKTTYYNVLKELDRWGHIVYRPSKDKGGRSKVVIPLCLNRD